MSLALGKRHSKMIKKINNRAFRKLKRKRFGYRFIGWWFLIQGLIMSIIFANLMLDPDGVITYNGVKTTAFDVKRNAFLFVSIFPIVGLAVILISKRRLNKLLIWQARINPFSQR